MISLRSRGGGRGLTIALVVVVVAAACGSEANTDTEIEGPGPGADAAALDETSVGDVEVLESVASGVRGLFDGSSDAADIDVAAAYQRLNAAVGAGIAAGADLDAVMATVDAALLASYRGPASAERAAAIGDALNGRAVDVAVIDSKTAQTGTALSAAVSDPRLKVYFVNGINNTLEFARGTSALLVQSLGHDVTHYYNPSAFNPDDYTQDWCARSIEALFAEQRQSALLAQIQADADAADAIAAAADQGTLAWFYQATTQSLGGVARDVDAAVGDVELTAAERAMSLACSQVDEIKNLLQQEAALGKFVLEWLANTYEVIWDRIDAALDISLNAETNLVEMIKTDITQGRRVLIVGHSHGTMKARFVLQEINRWYTDDVLEPCPNSDTAEPAAVAPIAALYVSPGFTVQNDPQQKGIMVDGDFLSLIGQAANVPASGSQLDAGPIDRHDLRRYLEPGTATLAHIQGAYTELTAHLAAIPDPSNACDPQADNPGADSGLGESVEPAGEPTWVLVNTVVNENGTDPHPYWHDLEASPGHLAWVFDDGDPTFGAVYDVSYDLPADELPPGQVYEIPVSISGAVITGDSQRFTSAEVILYINRGWDGAVRLEQNCVAQADGLQCDQPAVVTGTLAFTAPTSGDAFEFNIDALNCGACEVTFRYELR